MEKPIGIFDSGVGGLTVAAAVRALLPQESFIYFGDTRHAPYGDKSAPTIIEYSRRITRFLIEQGCKTIVIACNSASATAYDILRAEFPEVHWLNVIDPAARFVVDQGYEHVGVIATRATARSEVYAKRLKALQPQLEVATKATPLLAPLIEEGFAGTEVSRGAIDTYLSEPAFHRIQALILGCTHYPLLKDEIEAYYRGGVHVVDSAHGVALALQALLQRENLLREAREPETHFFVSENTLAFTQVARRFFGSEIALEERLLPA